MTTRRPVRLEGRDSRGEWQEMAGAGGVATVRSVTFTLSITLSSPSKSLQGFEERSGQVGLKF